MPHDAPDGPLWQTLVASTLAGLAARFVAHPLDTCKARLQASSKATASAKFRTLGEVLRGTWAAEGVAGFYRGAGIGIPGAAVGSCLFLTSYEEISRWLQQRTVLSQGAALHLTAGLGAEAVSCVVFVPVDVLKERLQVQRSYEGTNYRGSWHAIRTVLKFEGLRGLYRGYATTLLSFGPYSAFMFAFYETFKDSARRLRGVGDLSFPDSLLAGVAAAGLAGLLTSPLDLVKLRLQIQRRKISATEYATEYNYRYPGFVSAVRSMAEAEGWRSFLKGADSRVLYAASMSALTLASYEWLKGKLQAH